MTAVLLLCLIFNYKFMKKKSECLGIYHYRWQKIGKIMKLCIILVCLFSFSLSATTLAQRERVNMKLQDVSLRQVLEQIREQTNLQFMMSKEQGERVGRVSVDAVNETVVEVLDKIFASTGLTWVVKEDIIVVKERPQQHSFRFVVLRRKKTTTEFPLCGQDKAHALHLPDVDGPALHGVDAGGVDGGVAQNVRQLYNIPARFVKRAGKEVAQIVGKHLLRRHARLGAQALHLRPNLFS